MHAGIDVGGTKVLLMLVDENERPLWQDELKSHEGGDAHAALQSYANTLVAEASRRGKKVRTMGVSLPGPVRDGRTLVVAPNLGWKSIDLAPTLAGVPAAYDQDARCATRAEARLGAGRHAHSFAYVTVGTGLGAALWIRDDVVAGFGGAAGELGHIKLPGSDAPCGCGGRGCLERTASGHGLERMYEKETGEHKSGRAIFELAQAGDPAASAVRDRFVAALGWGLSVLVGLVNPERLVFGGGIVAQFANLRGELESVMDRDVMPPARSTVSLHPAELGPESAALGAALLGRARAQR